MSVADWEPLLKADLAAACCTAKGALLRLTTGPEEVLALAICLAWGEGGDRRRGPRERRSGWAVAGPRDDEVTR